MNQSIEDRKRLLTDKDFFDCFRLCDADLDGEIGVADLRRILKFSGLPYSKKDALAMIQMADPAATTLRWDTFRRIMHCDLVGHSKEDYYQALSMHVPRIDGQLLVERNDLKRNLLAFVRLNDYTLARLSTLLREFLDVQRQNKFEVMMEFKELEAFMECVKDEIAFTIIFRKLDPAYISRVDVRCFLISVLLFIDAPTAEKAEFAFDALDNESHGFLDVADLELFFRASYLTTQPEITFHATQRIFDAQGTDEITRNDFIALCCKYPNTFFPSSIHTRDSDEAPK